MDKITVKRTADWLEKMSVAAMAVGLFQDSYWGIILSVACYIACLHLSHEGAE